MKKLVLAITLLSCSFATLAAQTLRFGTEASYAPFEFMNEKNEIVGFDIDIAKAVCQKIDATCTFNNQSFDSLIPSLKFRRIDAVIAGMDITPERSQQVLFSTPYYDNSAMFIINKDKFASIDALKGKRVGVQNGTTHQKYLSDKHPELSIASYDSYQNAILDLKNGRIDAVFSDTAVGDVWLDKEKNLSLLGDRITDSDYFGAGLAIAVRLENTPLVEQINKALADIKQDGTYQTIYHKWFK